MNASFIIIPVTYIVQELWVENRRLELNYDLRAISVFQSYGAVIIIGLLGAQYCTL